MRIGEDEHKLSVRVVLFEEGLLSFSDTVAKVAIVGEFDVLGVWFRDRRSGSRDEPIVKKGFDTSFNVV